MGILLLNTHATFLEFSGSYLEVTQSIMNIIRKIRKLKNILHDGYFGYVTPTCLIIIRIMKRLNDDLQVG